ncbi:MAG TPA: CBS domain-containing protein [Gemmatimonadaceae bacterium]
MKASDIMTPHPACVTPADTARTVAQLMVEHDCGALPVVSSNDDHRLLGMITDRDLAVRAVAQGKGPDTPVSELMTSEPRACPPEAKLEEVEKVMADGRVRRLPITDANEQVVGIIAQADLARVAKKGRKPTPESFVNVVGKISQPTSTA